MVNINRNRPRQKNKLQSKKQKHIFKKTKNQRKLTYVVIGLPTMVDAKNKSVVTPTDIYNWIPWSNNATKDKSVLYGPNLNATKNMPQIQT